VARVRIRAGAGVITINDRPFEEYFTTDMNRKQVLSPLEKTEQKGSVDLIVKVSGGGPSSQAGAVLLGVARALMIYNPELEPKLREANLLTRDSRMKERKKYGHKGARKSFQFSKR
jgi:small subunit ribosomal protein S9